MISWDIQNNSLNLYYYLYNGPNYQFFSNSLSLYNEIIEVI